MPQRSTTVVRTKDSKIGIMAPTDSAREESTTSVIRDGNGDGEGQTLRRRRRSSLWNARRSIWIHRCSEDTVRWWLGIMDANRSARRGQGATIVWRSRWRMVAWARPLGWPECGCGCSGNASYGERVLSLQSGHEFGRFRARR